MQFYTDQLLPTIGYWEWLPDSRTFHCSDALLKLYGLESCQSVSDFDTLINEFTHSDDKKALHKQLQETLNHQTPLNFQYRLIRPDGEIRHAHIQGELVRGYNNGAIRIMGSITDISQLKNNETTQQHYQHIVNSSSDFSIFIDTNYIIRAANQNYLDINQKELAEVIGHRVEDIENIESYQQIIKPNIDKCLAGKSFNFQLWFEIPDSKKLYLDMHYSTCYGDNDEVSGVVITGRDITEQKQHELASKQNEILLQSYFDAGMIGMAITTSGGGFVQFNDTFCELIGYHREDLMTMTWKDFTHPDDLDIGRVERNLIHTGERDGYTVEKRYIRRDGSVINAQLALSAIRTTNGKVENFVVFIQDITERKQIEETQKLYESIINTHRLPIVFVDMDYIYQAVNQSFLTTFNKSREEVIGRSISEVLGQDHFERYSEPNINKCLKGETVDVSASYVNLRSGEHFLEANYIPYKNKDGVITGIVISTQFITELKKTQQALEKNQLKLQQAQRLAQVGFWERSFNDKKLTLSDELCNIYGINPKEFDGRREFLIKFIHPDDREDALNHYDNVVNSDHFKFEHRIVRADGETRFLSIVGEVSFDSDQKPQHIFGTTIDITDVKQVESALITSEKRSREAQRIAHVGVWEWDITGDKLYWSDELYKITQRKPEEFTLSADSAMEIVHPEDRQQVRERIDQAIEDSAPYNLEYRNILPDGEIQYVHSQGEVIRNEKSTPVKMLGTLMDISERKKAAEILKRYEQIVNSVSDHMVFIDQDYTYLAANQQFLDAFGLKREETIGLKSYDIMGRENFETTFKPKFDKALSGEAHTVQMWSDNYSYGKRFIEISYIPYVDTNKEISGVIIISHDITESKQAQDALKLYEQIVNSVSDYMTFLSPDYTYLAVNQKFLDTVNLLREDVIGHKSCEIIGQENFDNISKYAYEKAFAGETYTTQAWTHHHKSGDRYLDFNYIPYRDDNGDVTGIITVTRDITETKQAQDALQKSENKLKEAQRIAQLGFWEWDMINDNIFWSDELYEMCGFNKSEFTPDNELIMQHIHPDDREAVRDCVRMAMKKGVPYISKHRFIKPDGEVRYHQISGEVTCNEEGTPISMMGTSLDITAMKLAELELIKHRDHLEELVNERTSELKAAQQELIKSERLATLGKLTATVSHELRNPLGAASLALYTLKKFIKLDKPNPTIMDTYDRLERNIKRCDNIIDELLDYTRIGNIELAPFKFDAWLNDVLDEQNTPTGITIIRDLNLDDTLINIDPDRFMRAIINVHDNGCHAMAANDDPKNIIPCASLKISTRITDHRIELLVADKGKGIPEEVMQKIFEPLFSTKTFGVGLGLPTVKQIMELHGGGIEIHSTENVGTDVILWLPLTSVIRKVAS